MRSDFFTMGFFLQDSRWVMLDQMNKVSMLKLQVKHSFMFRS